MGTESGYFWLHKSRPREIRVRRSHHTSCQSLKVPSLRGCELLHPLPLNPLAELFGGWRVSWECIRRGESAKRAHLTFYTVSSPISPSHLLYRLTTWTFRISVLYGRKAGELEDARLLEVQLFEGTHTWTHQGYLYLFKTMQCRQIWPKFKSRCFFTTQIYISHHYHHHTHQMGRSRSE